jgi:hypothetical protein
MSSSEFAGSCLCGAVSYEISGAPFSFFHCHCRRCRKSNGTGHASNILLKPESFEWTAGEDNLGGFKVPDAQRFRTVFCKTCGSPLPRVTPDFSLAVIPAGSLDTEPPLKPTARIFWDSRTDWSCAEGGVPAWPEYPEKP